jgi:threonyl-tRNA synthetase
MVVVYAMVHRLNKVFIMICTLKIGKNLYFVNIYFILNSNRTVSGLDYEPLEKTMKRIVKEEQPFERLEISKEDLLRLFGVRNKIELFYQ